MSEIAAPAGRDLITNSRAQCFKTCRRKHYFAYVLGVRKEPSEALRLGGAVHEGLDVFKKTNDMALAIGAVVENYEKLLFASQSMERDELLLLECEKAVQLVKGWIWRWGDDASVEIVASELRFRQSIRNPETNHPNRNHYSAGKIDGICSVDGRLLLLEHKTCSEDVTPGSEYWDRVRLDEQITRYILASREADWYVEGVFYDVIRKPSISPKQVPNLDDDGRPIVLDESGERVFKANGEPVRTSNSSKGWKAQTHVESTDEYGKRLYDDIRARPDFYFARMEIPRLESELAEMREEIWQVAQDIRHAETNGHHFKNSHSCKSPYPCAYLPICTQGLDLSGELPEGFIRLNNVNPELEDDHADTDTPACGPTQEAE